MFTIYKITNQINKKIYIGATRMSIEERWKLHISASKSKKTNMRLYLAMRKYGIENFKIEIIDSSAKNEIELEKLETKYIIQFESRNPDKGYNFLINNYITRSISPKTGITEYDVIEIRKLYAQCTFGPKYWYDQKYKNILSYSGFEKIWEGTSWKHIMPEVFTEQNKNYYRKNKKSMCGENNHCSVFSDEEIMLIRKMFVNYTAEQIYLSFKDRCSMYTIKNILYGSNYKHLPIYKKSKKKWFLNNIEINIEQYNPVSTISGSGE